MAAALWFACLSACALAQPFAARVSSVIDGDTLVVANGRHKLTVRLADIDAPEKDQAHGAASRDALAALVLHQAVQVMPLVTDDYGRMVATLHLGDIDVNATQVRRGWAWENSRFHANRNLKALEREARRARRGLWGEAHPLPPWEFRKGRAAKRDAPLASRACGKKQHCAQMVSCDEARFYFTRCGVKSLDGNGDGVPCGNLCTAGGK